MNLLIFVVVVLFAILSGGYALAQILRLRREQQNALSNAWRLQQARQKASQWPWTGDDAA